MGAAAFVRVLGTRRERPIRHAPRSLIALTALVTLAVFAGAVPIVASAAWTGRSVRVLVLLAVLALIFEEFARRAARLRLRLAEPLKTDLTSVWAAAAAVGLPAGQGMILLAVLLIYIWERQQRPAGEYLHRKLFNAATIELGFLAASGAYHLVAAHATTAWSLHGALNVVVALVVYAVTQRALVTAALLCLGGRGSDLLGSWDDNLVELATLCLGGLVALAVVHQPLLAVLALIPMISLQRGALVRELEVAATTDAKTGLLNAVAWEHVAAREVARAHRERTPLGLLIIDIDRFKLVNDRYGHLVGDAVLRDIGRCLSAEVREYDSVGRFGGEEFVVVLPAANERDSMLIAERLRARVHELRVSVVAGVEANEYDALAVSIGVAVAPADGVELPDLLYAADSALYRAKAAGRNRVLLADRDGGTPESVALG
jgi:diguanylate cyclase (GGDEF)-like protein